MVAAFRLDARGRQGRELRAAYGGMAARVMRAADARDGARRQTVDARRARRHRRAAGARLQADERSSRRRRLPLARRRRTCCAGFQLETSTTARPRAWRRYDARRSNASAAACMREVRHDSAVGHVTGRALYLDDMPTVPGTLEAALVLSPHAHARIRPHRFFARAGGARRASPQSRPPIFRAGTTSRRSAATSRCCRRDRRI